MSELRAVEIGLVGRVGGEQQVELDGTDTPVRFENVDRVAHVNKAIDDEFNRNLRVNLGVSNLLDKRLDREDSGTAQGAATYNEPGRAFYASVTTSF